MSYAPNTLAVVIEAAGELEAMHIATATARLKDSPNIFIFADGMREALESIAPGAYTVYRGGGHVGIHANGKTPGPRLAMVARLADLVK